MAKRKELIKIIKHHDEIAEAVKWAVSLLDKGLHAGAAALVVTRPRRSKDQNAKLWPMLNDFANQKVWCDEKLTPKQWKDLFTALLVGQEFTQGLEGGIVFFGTSTSKMCKSEFCDLVELMYAKGAEWGIKWSEPKRSAEEMWRE